MKVRTGDSHPFDENEARIDQFTVEAVPMIDYAAKALREAQDAYFKAWPQARKHARDYLWEIKSRREVARSVPVGDSVLTVPVSDEVAEAIREWSREHADDLNRRLDKFGLGNYNIVEPQYERIVTRDEL